MKNLRVRILRALMILSCAVLPSGFIECDFDDDEIEINFRELPFDEVWVDFWVA